MMYAEEEGKRKLAQPGLKANCPLCGNEVIAKCGSIKIWHWAHLAEQSCDDFKEHESEWHRTWKELFPEEFREVVIEKQGNVHIADVRLSNGMVIEFQNSSIGFEDVVQRERFYREMVWIFNCEKGIDRIKTFGNSIEWWNPRRDYSRCRKRVYLDLGDKLLKVDNIDKDKDGDIPNWSIYGEFIGKSDLLGLLNVVEKRDLDTVIDLPEGVYAPAANGGWKFKRKLTGREWWEYEHLYESHVEH